jgi:DNA-binding NtrC family response regulator
MTDDKILVVDDEVGMVTLLRNYLTREGYDVTTAPSAEVALPMVEEHDIAVVVTICACLAWVVWNSCARSTPCGLRRMSFS